jgi:ketosteroid isomerase-like protein
LAIKNAVTRWAQAWSAKDVDAYLAAYASDFTAAGMPRSKWEAQRRARIAESKKIEVKISDLKVKQQGDTANATFRQAYRSDRHHSTATKTLELALQNGQWRTPTDLQIAMLRLLLTPCLPVRRFMRPG